MKHIRVRAIADYFEVEALPSFAIEQVTKLLGKRFTTKAFSFAFEEAYRSISNETILKKLSDFAVAHIETLMQLELFKRLETPDGFFSRVMLGTLAEHQHREKVLSFRLRDKQSTITDLEQKRLADSNAKITAEIQLDQITADVDESRNLFQRRSITARCSKCRRVTRSVLKKQAGFGPKYILCCKVCGFQH